MIDVKALADALEAGRFGHVERMAEEALVRGVLPPEAFSLWIEALLRAKRSPEILAAAVARARPEPSSPLLRNALTAWRRQAAEAALAKDWLAAERRLAALGTLGGGPDLNLAAWLATRRPALLERLVGWISDALAEDRISLVPFGLQARLEAVARAAEGTGDASVAAALRNAALALPEATDDSQSRDDPAAPNLMADALLHGVDATVIARLHEALTYHGSIDQLADLVALQRADRGAVDLSLGLSPGQLSSPSGRFLRALTAWSHDDLTALRHALLPSDPAVEGLVEGYPDLAEAHALVSFQSLGDRAASPGPILRLVERTAVVEALPADDETVALAPPGQRTGAERALPWTLLGRPGLVEDCRRLANAISEAVYGLDIPETTVPLFQPVLRRALTAELIVRTAAVANADAALKARTWGRIELIAATPGWAEAVAALAQRTGVGADLAWGVAQISAVRRLNDRLAHGGTPQEAPVGSDAPIETQRVGAEGGVLVLATENRPDLLSGLEPLLARLADHGPTGLLFTRIGRADSPNLADDVIQSPALGRVGVSVLDGQRLWRDGPLDQTELGRGLATLRDASWPTVVGMTVDPLVRGLLGRILAGLRGFDAIDQAVRQYAAQTRPRAVIAPATRSPVTDAALAVFADLGVATVSLQLVQNPIANGLMLPGAARHLVLDEAARADYIRLGADAAAVTAVGSIRQDVESGTGADDPPPWPYILVATQPLGEAAMRPLVEAAAGAIRSTQGHGVVVKLHPSETDDVIDRWRTWFDAEGLGRRARVVRDAVLPPLLRDAAAVVVRHSNVGIEAAMLGRPVITLGDAASDGLSLSALGVAAQADDSRQAAAMLTRILQSGEEPAGLAESRAAYRAANPSLAPGAVDRVVAALLGPRT
ncbi:hypothetical protein [Brevundimonas lutea]|uniref:capsular polysaccharide export protein, LipB/KpsS family n=1 Tax=Brevundimonas lutea TaxID=2293980 RepID=UPI000F01A60D|nr:hypothetical protein [Brevundimonas lutea]